MEIRAKVAGDSSPISRKAIAKLVFRHLLCAPYFNSGITAGQQKNDGRV
jgi:hypothetical protein